MNSIPKSGGILSIQPHLDGYYYLSEAIALVVNDDTYLHSITKSLYPTVAEHCSSTPQRVERSIRYAIEKSFLVGDINALEKCFGAATNPVSGKVTNSVLVACLSQKIRLGELM